MHPVCPGYLCRLLVFQSTRRIIRAYLAVGNYALAVYGYGVEDYEIDSIVRTLKFGTLAAGF